MAFRREFGPASEPVTNACSQISQQPFSPQGWRLAGRSPGEVPGRRAVEVGVGVAHPRGRQRHIQQHTAHSPVACRCVQ